ncbi:bifunctional UDP-N-acetylmuramoyl-L-alanyl-D-glutamate--2,6-diaminopimelate ligase MurE/UDP-N-acetylmuramoyl-tripeptide--D-alanyl-D-alanine ligase MurF [Alcaligenes parafaecalis]|uniref:Multifunctional fusion protein n=1 Tax=Alcaligenes parafaecalis TaxID=171260 RepID=A0ABT3VR90_9BURK|nr:bifunctional UDP-N-acetylmuramoyl-L-alanyl-D-glutamate--2,6-diaminopimelate ligase MurE/UDP-N-acetylmuramoyl-tripeptide--D-alanyl-D-alanine ligase MurF [Alcaligenes parafaecalis]MCX5464725.1 bifunctional UDP-N-acetylmuramoyl-L-alanyl-D-glutamate--2,6-diaminopimelate ligase MurE/UDP-N-acetylmuramoyl-tripeptide--D-alanyl-D-alanine ligase MurF [Alcaligenes parafaecalis]
MNAAAILEWLAQHVAPTANLCLDSRQIKAGDAFFACRGHQGDGREYEVQAVQQGAVAIVREQGDQAVDPGVPVLQVANLSALLGEVAHQWWGRPSEEMTVVAVTGTNGKTSTVQWVASALNHSQVPCGTIGTLGVTLPDGSNLGGVLTTPDVLTVHRSLAAIRAQGGNAVALEASSIGLEQGRLDGVRIDIAGFTNLTHDHLDYHHSMEQYKQAKLRLFSWPGLRSVVLNADDATGRELMQAGLAARVISYSMSQPEVDLLAQDVHTGADGQVFNLVTAHGTAQILTHLLGEHNVANLLLVAGVLQEVGWPVSKIARIMDKLESVPGRLQIVTPNSTAGRQQPLPLVVVDYAHTADALERALQALREVATVRGGKLTCVFGCGGNRDTAKRPVMGEVAARLADNVLVTTDNPRFEDPADIIRQIVAGMPEAPAVQMDRARAILSSVWAANPEDIVLLAGKGHETYQEVQGERSVFDDSDWAKAALLWLRGVRLSTDSRSLTKGDLFLALSGEQFDGHRYLEKAKEQGAHAAIVAQRDPQVDLPQIVLGDTRRALMTLATEWRSRFDIPVIGVTGSNGKTTTKEMIAAILRAWLGDAESLATRGNLNNDLGVPLSILRLSSEHKAAVLEMGMNHPGEIAVLAAMARPTIALINNAQREHQEFMHSVEAVARENGAVIDALPQDGALVIPDDDAFSAMWAEQAGQRSVLRFGLSGQETVFAADMFVEPAQTRFVLHVAGQSAALTLSSPGIHNLRNALAAAACAHAAGAPLNAIVQGLESFRPVTGRMQPKQLSSGYQLIDDTYNANPDSVRAAIDVLAQLKGRKVLVLGNMAEIGDNSSELHAEVGAYAKERGMDELLTLGGDASHAAQAFGARAHQFETLEDMVSYLLALEPSHVLIKGSRSARMERVVAALENHFSHNEGATHAS